MCTDDGARHDGDVYFIGGTSGRNAVWDMSDDAFEFADNAKAKFGSSDDLQIYHDSTDSLIDFTNTVMRLKYIQNFNNISEIQSFTYLFKMLSWCYLRFCTFRHD